MSTGPTNLFDLASALLAVCVNAITVANGDGGPPVPDVNYVFPGRGIPPAPPPGGDVCSALIVGPGDPVIYHGVPSGSESSPMAFNHVMPRTAVLVVYVYRCMTGGMSGEGMELTQINATNTTNDAETVFTDAFVLHQGIVLARADGEFLDFTTGLVVDPAQALEMEGNVGGCLVTVRAELS